MDALICAIVLWLSSNFELPATENLPRIEFASVSRMVALRNRDTVDKHQNQGNAITLDAAAADTLAIYRDDSQTIYLRDNWTGKTPAELSILVHEVVHHLQSVARLRFECPQEREQLAYQAQERWLGLFGRNLESDFGLDPMSVFLKSKCFY